MKMQLGAQLMGGTHPVAQVQSCSTVLLLSYSSYVQAWSAQIKSSKQAEEANTAELLDHKCKNSWNSYKQLAKKLNREPRGRTRLI